MKSIILTVGAIIAFMFFAAAPPSTTPINICMNCNASYVNWSTTMAFCADGNSLVLDAGPASNTYHELYGTHDLMPMCMWNDTLIANYSGLNLTQGQIARLPKFVNQTVYNMTCIHERCNKLVAVDFQTGKALIIWDNATKKEYLYQ